MLWYSTRIADSSGIEFSFVLTIDYDHFYRKRSCKALTEGLREEFDIAAQECRPPLRKEDPHRNRFHAFGICKPVKPVLFLDEFVVAFDHEVGAEQHSMPARGNVQGSLKLGDSKAYSPSWSIDGPAVQSLTRQCHARHWRDRHTEGKFGKRDVGKP